jgi:hypothetical protein
VALVMATASDPTHRISEQDDGKVFNLLDALFRKHLPFHHLAHVGPSLS